MPYTVPMTAPIGAAASLDEECPAILPFRVPTSAWPVSLLDEAIGLAKRLGCRVVDNTGHGNAWFWVRGRKRLLLDATYPVVDRLATIAEALRDDHRVASAEMSASLEDFLEPRRAA